MVDPFAVKDCALIAVATGEHVLTIRELKDKLGTIPTSCIYYHFWGGLLRPMFDDPVYQNDFAIWSWRGLHDKTLAEKLSVINPTGFKDLDELHEHIPHMSSGVIFYHLIDARRRIPQWRNDFTEWLMGYGEEHQELAMCIAGIDPYFTTLSELRDELHRVFSVYTKERW